MVLEHLETLQCMSNDSWTSPEWSWIDFMIIIFHECWWFWPHVPMFGMIPSSPWNEFNTILNYVKNDYDSCREWFIWWRFDLDNLGQRGHRNVNRRNPLWPLWLPHVTWRRVLRTRLALDNMIRKGSDLGHLLSEREGVRSTLLQVVQVTKSGKILKKIMISENHQ